MNEIRCTPAIVDVTVYPRQARIVREAKPPLRAGENLVVAGPLPRTLTADSLRAQTAGSCRILELVVEERLVPIVDTEGEFRALESEVRVLRDERASLANRLRALYDEYRVFADRAPLDDEEDKPPLINVTYWREFLAFLEERLVANRADSRAAFFAYLEIEDKLRAAEDRLRKIASREIVTEHVAVVRIEAGADGETTLRLSSLQDGASWHPAYSIRAYPSRGQAELSAYAMVRQESGEDWDGVRLLFSTAMPLEDCSLPELKSRRLREAASEAILMQTAPQAPAEANALFDAECEERAVEPPAPIAKKLKAAMDAAPASMSRSARRGYSGGRADNRECAKELGSGVGGGYGGPAAQAPAPGMVAAVAAPPPSPKRVSAPPSEQISDYASVYAEVGATDALLAAVPDRGGFPPIFAEYARYLSAPRKPAFPKRGVSEVNDLFRSGEDPEASCGGYDYRYEAASDTNTVPSVADLTQVPVRGRTLEARFVRVAVPAASDKVYLKATVTNCGTPLPAGNAQVFLENDFVAGIRLPTLGSNAAFDVSLGVDEDVKLVRREDSKTATKGIAAKETVTDFEVVIELANFKDKQVEVEVYDRHPVSRDPKDATVIGPVFDPPPERRSDRGVVLWRATLAPGAKAKLSMRYSIKAKEDRRLVLTTDGVPHDGTWTGGAA